MREKYAKTYLEENIETEKCISLLFIKKEQNKIIKKIFVSTVNKNTFDNLKYWSSGTFNLSFNNWNLNKFEIISRKSIENQLFWAKYEFPKFANWTRFICW